MAIQLPFADADIFVQVRDFAAQNLLNRVLAYGAMLLIAAIIVTGLFMVLGWQPRAVYTLVALMLVYTLLLLYADPEGEYTKEDVMTMFVLAALMPGVMYFLAQLGTGMIAQFASPLVALQEVATEAGAAVVQGAAEEVGGFGWYLGMFLMYMGVLGGSFGLAVLIREE